MVTGQVTLDGKPLSGGVVVTSYGMSNGARARIDPQGRFTLTASDLGPGAAGQTHHIAVIAYEQTRTTDIDPEAPRKLIVPQSYTNPETSSLEIPVEPDVVNDVILKLSSTPE